MREKHMLKIALESGKATSRKQKEKLSVPASPRGTSRVGSNGNSRSASRQVSDDEDGNMSDSTAMSVGSIQDFFDDDDDLPDTSKIEDFKIITDQIIDRKGSSVQGRELTLRQYIHFLTHHVVSEDVEARTDELIPSFLKSIKNEDSEKEVCFALKAITLTLVTAPSDNLYETLSRVLKRLIVDGDSPFIRAEAIRTLSAATIYGGAGDAEIEEIMNELIDILESDDITDKKNDLPFRCALEEWAFLASYLDDIEELTEAAAMAFQRQLANNAPEVLIAAGDALALLFEKSYTEREPEDGPASKQDQEDNLPIDNQYVKRYDVVSDYAAAEELKETVNHLATDSKTGLRVDSKASRELHKKFRDVLQTMEHPARGPGWRNTEDQETGKKHGHSVRVKIQNKGTMNIDRWWKWHRYQDLRRNLGGGFIQHYEDNPTVFETLPLMLSKGPSKGR